MTAEIVYPKFGAQLCFVCGKRPATRLCDAPFGRIANCHTGRQVLTCDRPICDECTIEIGPEIDFCPKCMERIKNAEKSMLGRRRKR